MELTNLKNRIKKITWYNLTNSLESILSETIEELDRVNMDMLLVESVEALTPYLSGDEYILPTNKLVIINKNVDLGDKAVRITTGTVLRGFATGTLISTNTNGVVRATNIDSPVIIREMNVVAPLGECFKLEGTLDHQLNMFFVGMLGAKAGTIKGFNVQSAKQCYINSADGLTFDGVTRKIFVADSPFYGITSGNSAMTFASTLESDVADIVTSFFKFDNATGITAEAGYTIGEGKVRGSLVVGTGVVPLVGLVPSDINWTMTDNSGIADSRIVGGLYLDTSAETTITTINTPVKVAGTTLGLALNERLVATTNRLTYTGLIPTIGLFTGSFAVSTGNNTNLTFYLAKNGVVLPESAGQVRVGTGGDERNGTISCLVDMVTDDYVEIWVENNDGTSNLTCLALSLNGMG